MSQPIFPKPGRKGLLLTSVILLLTLVLGACGGNPQNQQQATQYRANLDKAVAHAQSIGVPVSLLQPILVQEQHVGQTSAPLTLFSDQPATEYYQNLAQRYQVLTLQVQGLEMQTTEKFDYQAYQDVQAFAGLLSQRQAQGFVSVKTFTDMLSQQQGQLAQAKEPKAYLQISSDATEATQALHLMGSTYDNLQALRGVIKQLQDAHIDTTVAQQQEQADVQIFRAAIKPADFSQLTDQINAQLQGMVALSTQAIPYVGAAKLKQFSDDITMMKQYGQNTAAFEKNLNDDQAALNNAKTIEDFLNISAKIDKDVAATEFPLLKAQASYLLAQFHQEVQHFGDTHQYHDSYNGQTYRYGYEYGSDGVGSDLDAAVQTARTPDDFQAATDFINGEMTNLKAMEANFNDQTAWNAPHATDLQLLKYHNVMSGQVIVVSLIEQAMRLYQNGQLVKAFQITSGQYAKPSPPGFWSILWRESPTVFKSNEPKGSAFWYPDTKINYAMEYHGGGYFFHDSWWRLTYGAGTEFPHHDASGDTVFSGTGSHGCINMQEQQAAWLYQNTTYNTSVILY